MITYSFGQFHLRVRSPGKILAKNPTLSSQKFFDCCDNTEVDGPQLNQTNITSTRIKISMKQLKRRKLQSTMQEQSQPRSKSKKTITSNKTSVQNLKTKNQNIAKIPVSSPINSQLKKKQSTIYLGQTRIHEKPKFSNFNTTNYVVGECLVQPPDNKLLFEQNQQINATIEHQLNTILNEKIEGPLKTKIKRQQKNKQRLQRNLRQKDPKQIKPYGNFSFGQRQKQEYLNKNQDNLTWSRKQPGSQKLKQSKIENKKLEMYEIDSKIQQELNKLSEEQKSKFRSSLQRKPMNYLVDNGGNNTMKPQAQHSSLQQSMVKNILKAPTQKYRHSKELSLVV